MRADLADFVNGVPGRFVPEAMSGQVVEAEHITRYWWASSYAEGRRVLDAGCGTGYGTALLAAASGAGATGIDLARDVIAAAAGGAADGIRFDVGDLHSLPYEDDAFDLVTCFEVIEHVEAQAAVLAELARVLAPGGLLLVSSPNRDVYVPGNPHHVHELTPGELAALLAPHWDHVRIVQQHNYLASTIVDGAGDGGIEAAEVRALVAAPPGQEVYTLGMASTAALPAPRSLVTLASSVEIREWLERYQEQQAVLHDFHDRLERRARDDEDRLEALRRLAEAEAGSAELIALRHERATAGAQRAEEQGELYALRDENLLLQERLARGERVVAELMRSPSWRITAPLRVAKRLLARR